MELEGGASEGTTKVEWGEVGPLHWDLYSAWGGVRIGMNTTVLEGGV